MTLTNATDEARGLRALITSRKHGHVILRNSAYLVAQTGANSLLGFLFWVVAARTLSTDQVGLGAAYISALTLLGMVADLGLSTAVIRFAPSMGARQKDYINSAATAVTIISLAAAGIFALGTPLWSPTLEPLAHSATALAIFALGTALFRLTQLLDDVFVAFEATQYVLIRNVVSNIVRLVIVLTAARLIGGTAIVLAVAGGSLAGVLVIAVLTPRVLPGYRLRPAMHWRSLHSTARYSLGNHFANLLWSIPSSTYPLIVVTLVGAAANAQFYMSWMIANLLYVIPVSVSLSTLARAVNAGHLNEAPFWRIIRIVLVVLLVPTLALIVCAPFLLRVFGRDYGVQNPWLFAVLALTVFPYTINAMAITFHRVAQRTGRIVLISALTTGACLVLSLGLGAVYALPGVATGWLIGQVVGVGVSLLSRPEAPLVSGGQALSDSTL